MERNELFKRVFEADSIFNVELVDKIRRNPNGFTSVDYPVYIDYQTIYDEVERLTDNFDQDKLKTLRFQFLEFQTTHRPLYNTGSIPNITDMQKIMLRQHYTSLFLNYILAPMEEWEKLANENPLYELPK